MKLGLFLQTFDKISRFLSIFDKIYFFCIFWRNLPLFQWKLLFYRNFFWQNVSFFKEISRCMIFLKKLVFCDVSTIFAIFSDLSLKLGFFSFFFFLTKSTLFLSEIFDETCRFSVNFLRNMPFISNFLTKSAVGPFETEHYYLCSLILQAPPALRIWKHIKELVILHF